jgi:histidinol dehydrogenase
VRVERLATGDDPAGTAARVRALAPGGESVEPAVREIVAAVRAGGDAALAGYVERFDRVTGSDPLTGEPPAQPASERAGTVTGSDPSGSLRVPVTELEGALAALEPTVRAGLEVAIANVRTVAEASIGEGAEVKLPQGQRVRVRELPVRRAAIYVPGGRAPYPSTVVMGVVTARTAGVDEVVVCAPGAHPLILGACALCGADEVWRMGGAHAVAALAYGTETIERVDVIAGPGNLYVQEAKRMVAGDVGIDGFAGPSDVLVIADEGADPAFVAADMLAQAEHGAGTIVAAVSDHAPLLDAVAARLDGDGQAVAALVDAPRLGTALDFANAFAPEHLQLMGPYSERLAEGVRNAGCVFVGAAGGTAFGDYVAGSNHVLPTGGSARFASALSPRHFRRRMAEVHVGDAAAELAAAGAPVADAEGFTRHAASMRLRENPPS